MEPDRATLLFQLADIPITDYGAASLRFYFSSHLYIGGVWGIYDTSCSGGVDVTKSFCFLSTKQGLNLMALAEGQHSPSMSTRDTGQQH